MGVSKRIREALAPPKQLATAPPWEWRRVGKRWVLWGAHGDRPIVLDFVREGMQGAAPRVRTDAHGIGLMVEFDPSHPDAELIRKAPELQAELAARDATIRTLREAIEAHVRHAPEVTEEQCRRSRVSVEWTNNGATLLALRAALREEERGDG